MRSILMLAFSLIAGLAVTSSAAAQPRSASPATDFMWRLEDLLHASGVSGFEGDVREQLLPEGVKARTDESGNLVATFGQGSPHTLVCADMDEDGYFVSAITDAGYLRVHRVTTGVSNRLFEQMHYGQPMFVRTQNGKRVAGVFVAASTHLQRGRAAAADPKGLDDLWIDVGATGKADVERLGIRMLDPVGLRERSQRLGNNRLAGVAAQTRAGDLALSLLAEGFLAPRPRFSGTLTIAWTARGSFGGRGMARLAQGIKPDRVIVVARMVVRGEGRNPTGSAGQLGAGVLVADNDAKTAEAAKEQGVMVQPAGGALPAPGTWPTADTVVLGLPVAFAQTPVEVVDLRDLAQLVALLRALTGAPPRPTSLVTTPPVERPAAATGLAAVLRPLVEAAAVSGAEGPVRSEILERLPTWARPRVDGHGNVTVTLGQGGKELLFVAHMDEIGYAVTDILDDGTASIARRGGFFDYLWEAHPVIVQTAKGAVPAVVAPRPNYLAASQASPRVEDLRLYFGTDSRAATQALGLAKGDTATIRKELTPLAGTRWTARSMDDRCGIAALLAALNRIDPAKVPNRVTFAFVVGEETGLVGSGFLAETLHPAVVFAVDTFVSSDSPVDPQRLALVPLGSGVVARAIDNSSITPADTVARLVSIGRAHKIPVTPSATSGGNDGSQFSRYGAIVAPLSWPGRYSHSPVEVMDQRDLEQLVNLVAALAVEY